MAPEGKNPAGDPAAPRGDDGRFGGFVLPGAGGFVYKWEQG